MPQLSNFAWCCCCRVPIDSHCESPRCVVDDVTPAIVHVPSGCTVHRIDVTTAPSSSSPPSAAAAASRTVRFVCVSDTHGFHRKLVLPDFGDPESTVLLHCGDFTGGTKYGPEQAPGGAAGVRDFNAWLAEVPYRHKVVVCGNHETRVPTDPAQARLLLSSATHYLCAEAAEVCGVRVFGAPHHPGRGCCYRKDAFGASLPEREKIFSRVPPGTHLLATHCPPYCVRDAEKPGHVGCGAALEALRRVRPSAHVFGHVHPHRGVSRMWHTTDDRSGALGAHGSWRPVTTAPTASSGGATGASGHGVDSRAVEVELTPASSVVGRKSSRADGGADGGDEGQASGICTATSTLIVNAASIGNADAAERGGVALPYVLELVIHCGARAEQPVGG